MLKAKQKLMEALIDIEIATNILKESEGAAWWDSMWRPPYVWVDHGTKSIVDANYEKLQTDLEPLEPGSEEYNECKHHSSWLQM